MVRSIVDSAFEEIRMLLFLSSGARNRYREDIVRSLVLPEGGFLQFRYDLSIVDVKILEGTKSGQLLNRDALVCYVWTGAVGAPTDFVPCRLARVIGAEIVGSSFVVRFEVAGYVQLGEGIDFIALLSEEDREKTPKWEQDADTLKLKGLFAIALKARPNLNTSKKLDAFESIVKKLRSFCDFSGEKGCQFFAVMGINSVMREPQGREVYNRMHLSMHGSFVLKSGIEYEMQVYIFAPDFGPTATVRETSIHIESENKLLDFPQGKSCEIDSEYDVKRFRFDHLQGPHQLYARTRTRSLPVAPPSFAGRLSMFQPRHAGLEIRARPDRGSGEHVRFFPLDAARRLPGAIRSQEITIALMRHLSDRYEVSITAAILKWIGITDKRDDRRQQGWFHRLVLGEQTALQIRDLLSRSAGNCAVAGAFSCRSARSIDRR
jgi:hypothetical protein